MITLKNLVNECHKIFPLHSIIYDKNLMLALAHPITHAYISYIDWLIAKEKEFAYSYTSIHYTQVGVR